MKESRTTPLDGHLDAPDERPLAGPAPGSRADGSPALSSRQERLWHLDRSHPGRILDQLTIVQRMRGRLDIEALRRSFRTVLARHEPLRMVCSATDGRPSVAFAAEELDLMVVDLRDLSVADWSEEVRRRADVLNTTPFDLATGPLVRASLLAGREEQYALLLGIHHIVCDMKSIEIIFRELLLGYEAAVTGQAQAQLPPLRLRFADVAADERRTLDSAEGAARLEWWRRRIGDHPRLAGAPRIVADCHASAIQRSLPRRASQNLASLSQRHNVPLFITLMTAFQDVLHRLDGEDDLLLHAHVLNRHSPEEKALVGYFVNVLSVRTDHSRPRRLPERLEQANRGWREARQHQLPICHLVRNLKPDCYAQRFMPSAAAFNMVPFAGEDMSVSGLHFEAPMTRCRATPFIFFDRMLIANPQKNGLKFNLLYNDLALSPRAAEDTADELVEELDGLASTMD